MAIVLALISAVVYGVSDYCGGRAARSAPLLGVILLTQLASATVTGTVVLVAADPFPGGADIAWSMAAGADVRDGDRRLLLRPRQRGDDGGGADHRRRQRHRARRRSASPSASDRRCWRCSAWPSPSSPSP